MNLCSIASGSSGNCIYVGSDDTHIIIDAGISGKRIEEGLNSLELTGADLDGILVTHEHTDHTAALGVLSRRYGIPIYATRGTIEGIKATSNLKGIDEGIFVEIEPESDFTINDLYIRSVSISHDANEPVAYRIGCFGKSVGVLTDLGKYDDHIVDSFAGVDSLLLEANHDIHMLQVGRYPYYLKERILSDKGHLCNEKSGQLLCRLLHDNMKAVLLGHLSAENNLAELAYEAVRLEILMDSCDYKPNDFEICVAKRDERSRLIAV